MKDKIFKRYSSGSDVGGYVGWLEVDGMCIAFIDTEGRVTWMEDLGLDPAATKDAEPQPPVVAESA